MKHRRFELALVIGFSFALGCSKSDTAIPVDSGPPPATLTLTSTSFAASAPVPIKYSCDGDDVSPPLTWPGVPAATKSFALIVDDPDAPGGTFTHWVLFDLPPTSASLAEASSGVGTAGQNGFGVAKYRGPCPPKGKGLHHYSFRIHALDIATLGLKEGASRADVDAALTGHVLGKGELVGTFEH